MDKRVFGLRNEYSVVRTAGGQVSAEEAGRRLFFEAKTVPPVLGRYRRAG